jgi:carbohydrate-binding DOMON domain-containing protein
VVSALLLRLSLGEEEVSTVSHCSNEVQQYVYHREVILHCEEAGDFREG